MRFEFVGVLAGAVALCACNGTMNGAPLDPTGSGSSSGWTSEPTIPSGASGLDGTEEILPGTECDDHSSTVMPPDAGGVVTGTSCRVSEDTARVSG